MKEEKKDFIIHGRKHRLTLTELRIRLDGTPTKHVLAVWEEGERIAARAHYQMCLKCLQGREES